MDVFVKSAHLTKGSFVKLAHTIEHSFGSDSYWYKGEKAAVSEGALALGGMVLGFFETSPVAMLGMNLRNLAQGKEAPNLKFFNWRNLEAIPAFLIVKSAIEGGVQIYHSTSSLRKDQSPENVGKNAVQVSLGVAALVGGVIGLKGIKASVRAMPSPKPGVSASGTPPVDHSKGSSPAASAASTDRAAPSGPGSSQMPAFETAPSAEGPYRASPINTNSKVGGTTLVLKPKPSWKLLSSHTHEVRLGDKTYKLILRCGGEMVKVGSLEYFFDSQNQTLHPADRNPLKWIPTGNQGFGYYYDGVEYLRARAEEVPFESRGSTQTTFPSVKRVGSSIILNDNHIIRMPSDRYIQFVEVGDAYFYDRKGQKIVFVEGAVPGQDIRRIFTFDDQKYYTLNGNAKYISRNKEGVVTQLDRIPTHPARIKYTDGIVIDGQLYPLRDRIINFDIGSSRYLISLGADHPVLVATYAADIPRGAWPPDYLTYSFLGEDPQIFFKPRLEPAAGAVADKFYVTEHPPTAAVSINGRLQFLAENPRQFLNEKFTDMRTGRMFEIIEIEGRKGIRLIGDAGRIVELKELAQFYPTDYFGRTVITTTVGPYAEYPITAVDFNGLHVYVSNGSIGRWLASHKLVRVAGGYAF